MDIEMQQYLFYFTKIVAGCEYEDKYNCTGISVAGCYSSEGICCATCQKLKLDDPGTNFNLIILATCLGLK